MTAFVKSSIFTVIIVLLLTGTISHWTTPMLIAEAAIWRAGERMKQVDMSDLIATYTACSQTKDPISCTIDDNHKITVTYFTGDNLHRKVYRSQVVWIDSNPRLMHGPMKRF